MIKLFAQKVKVVREFLVSLEATIFKCIPDLWESPGGMENCWKTNKHLQFQNLKIRRLAYLTDTSMHELLSSPNAICLISKSIVLHQYTNLCLMYWSLNIVYNFAQSYRKVSELNECMP